jgi:competence protein ComEC
MRYSEISMKKWILAVVFALTVFFSLVLASCGFVVDDGTSEPAPLRVSFLDVGQGLAVLLEYGGRFALYDTGPDSVGVVDSLVARGVDTLEWVVMSHSHRDHAGGILELGGAAGSVWAGNAPRVHVRHLYVGPDTAGGFVRDSVLGLARRFDIPVDTLYRGDMCEQISGSGDAPQFDVLWPPDYVHEGGNPASVVLRAEFGAASMLLTGDLDSAGERRLLELSPTLSADLLQVPHHGSAGSSSLRFVARVAPDYAVASVGAGNSYGHPREEVVRKYGYVLGDTARFFRTDRDGTVEFELWPDIGVVTGRD